MSNVIRVNGQAKGGSRFHKIIVAILSAILIDFVGTFGLLSLSTKLTKGINKMIYRAPANRFVTSKSTVAA